MVERSRALRAICSSPSFLSYHRSRIAFLLNRFREPPHCNREALGLRLFDLRSDALARAESQWRRYQAPTACHGKAHGV